MATSLVGLHTCTYIRVYCYFANRLHSVFFAFRRRSTRKRKSLQSLSLPFFVRSDTKDAHSQNIISRHQILFIPPPTLPRCLRDKPRVIGSRNNPLKKTEEKFRARYFRHPRYSTCRLALIFTNLSREETKFNKFNERFVRNSATEQRNEATSQRIYHNRSFEVNAGVG